MLARVEQPPRRRLAGRVSALAIFLGLIMIAAAPTQAADLARLPPAIGPTEPRVAPVKGDDGIYTQSWFSQSFLDMREDHAEAKGEGKRFAVIFEQRGCIYCTKMHTEVMSQKYINDYVRANFKITQIDLFGSREVTDFDGRKLTEKRLAERWGILFTPTIVFFKDDLKGLEGRWGRELEAVERMPLGIGAGTFYDMFVWVRHKINEQDRNFQRFHIARHNEREALAKALGKTRGK